MRNFIINLLHCQTFNCAEIATENNDPRKGCRGRLRRRRAIKILHCELQLIRQNIIPTTLHSKWKSIIIISFCSFLLLFRNTWALAQKWFCFECGTVASFCFHLKEFINNRKEASARERERRKIKMKENDVIYYHYIFTSLLIRRRGKNTKLKIKWATLPLTLWQSTNKKKLIHKTRRSHIRSFFLRWNSHC